MDSCRPVTDGGPTTQKLDPEPPPECTVDADGTVIGCSLGEVCNFGVCELQTECTTNSDCGDPTPVCDTTSNECVQCIVDGNCFSSQDMCVGNTCQPKPAPVKRAGGKNFGL